MFILFWILSLALTSYISLFLYSKPNYLLLFFKSKSSNSKIKNKKNPIGFNLLLLRKPDIESFEAPLSH